MLHIHFCDVPWPLKFVWTCLPSSIFGYWFQKKSVSHLTLCLKICNFSDFVSRKLSVFPFRVQSISFEHRHEDDPFFDILRIEIILMILNMSRGVKRTHVSGNVTNEYVASGAFSNVILNQRNVCQWYNIFMSNVLLLSTTICIYSYKECITARVLVKLLLFATRLKLRDPCWVKAKSISNSLCTIFKSRRWTGNLVHCSDPCPTSH